MAKLLMRFHKASFPEMCLVPISPFWQDILLHLRNLRVQRHLASATDEKVAMAQVFEKSTLVRIRCVHSD